MSDLNNFKGSLIPTLKFVQSSNVVGISYDKDSKTLYVLFGNKKAYKYLDVEKYDYEFLIKSPSVGSFLSRSIKPKYQVAEAFITSGYLVTDYKDCKIVITDLDDGRGYIYIDGEKHQLFDASPKVDDVKYDLFIQGDIGPIRFTGTFDTRELAMEKVDEEYKRTGKAVDYRIDENEDWDDDEKSDNPSD